jgi:hypothetical protein
MADPILVDINKRPRQSYPFLWADYVELLALCSQDGRFSRGNLAETEQEINDLETDDNENDETKSQSEQDDAISQRWADIKPRLELRSKTFAYWPFELRGNVLHRCYDDTNPGHRLYVTLLIAASYRLCHEKRAGEVGAALEELAYLLMTKMLGKGWEVRPFGAHQSIAGGYAGTLRQKLEALAIDVHARLMKDEEDYSPSNTGDGGLDVVAWNTFGDNRGHMPVIFAQCGCSPTDWEHKQLSVTPAAIEAHITPQHPGEAWYVSPQDLYLSHNRWDREAHVAKVILLDRFRLLNLAKEHDLGTTIPAWPFASEAASLQYKLTA